jgi:hypothetical protein
MKKTRNPRKRLDLGGETIRSLDTHQLTAAGGYPTETFRASGCTAGSYRLPVAFFLRVMQCVRRWARRSAPFETPAITIVA